VASAVGFGVAVGVVPAVDFGVAVGVVRVIGLGVIRAVGFGDGVLGADVRTAAGGVVAGVLTVATGAGLTMK
jgi:hypothetical protein